MTDYRFCENGWASGRSKWHIRPLTDVGPKYGGGADTPALCGRQVAWDVAVEITDHHLGHCCSKCASLYLETREPMVRDREALSCRVAQANMLLDTLPGKIMLYLDGARLRMSWADGKHDFPAHLRGDGSWPRYGYNQRPTGGTGMQALAQVIRFVRDDTRLPMVTWEYWASDTIGLATDVTLRRLRRYRYDDPEKTKCVLCGETDFRHRGLDWWSLDGVTGPSCKYGQCSPNYPNQCEPEIGGAA